MRTIYILIPILVGAAVWLVIVGGIWRLDSRMKSGRHDRLS
jgi:hypothetical protein